MVLFLLPQGFNFVYSCPQLFAKQTGIPCPRHRMPQYDVERDVVFASTCRFRYSELTLLGRGCFAALRAVRLASFATVRAGAGAPAQLSAGARARAAQLATAAGATAAAASGDDEIIEMSNLTLINLWVLLELLVCSFLLFCIVSFVCSLLCLHSLFSCSKVPCLVWAVPRGRSLHALARPPAGCRAVCACAARPPRDALQRRQVRVLRGAGSARRRSARLRRQCRRECTTSSAALASYCYSLEAPTQVLGIAYGSLPRVHGARVR